MQQNYFPVDKSSAEHYVWGDVCDGWRLLKNSDLSVIQERVPPGTGEVWHLHKKARQFFFILSGQAVMEFDEQSISLKTGQGIHVLPGIPHRFVNPSSTEEVVFLVISTPDTAGDRVNLP